MNTAVPVSEAIYTPRCMISWQVLSATAGMVNGFAFLLCQEFVTHMTGTVTRVGLEWQSLSLMVEYFFIVISFVMGSAVAIVALNARAIRTFRSPWVVPLSLVLSILSAVAVLGAWGAFGTPASTFSHGTPTVFLLSLLAFAMGIQNASIPSASGLGVRTTHLSGHATNLGIQIATVYLTQGKTRQSAMHGVVLRSGKILSFALGAALIVPLTIELSFLALLVPAGCILSAILLSHQPGTP